jgi:uncharacterized membrane protein (TIGR02234 family)
VTALTRRPAAILIATLSALMATATAGRPWVRGTVDDAMVGGSIQEVTGQEAVTGFVALGLVVLAGAVAAAATRRLGRRVAAVILLVTALGMAGLVLRVLLDPGAVLGAIAAANTGRTGALSAEGQATPWAYLALLPALGAFVTAALAWRGARSWPEPSAAYDRPGSERPGDRGERVATEWDRLSSGEDPTVDRGTP